MTKLILFIIFLNIAGSIFKKWAAKKRLGQPQAPAPSQYEEAPEEEEKKGFDFDDPGKELADFFKRLEEKTTTPAAEEGPPAPPAADPVRAPITTSSVRLTELEKKEVQWKEMEKRSILEGKESLVPQSAPDETGALAKDGGEVSLWQERKVEGFFDSKAPLITETEHSSAITVGELSLASTHQPARSFSQQLAAMPLMKQGIILSEVLGKPRALQAD